MRSVERRGGLCGGGGSPGAAEGVWKWGRADGAVRIWKGSVWAAVSRAGSEGL